MGDLKDKNYAITENYAIIFSDIYPGMDEDKITIINNRWTNDIGISKDFKNTRNISLAFEFMAKLLTSDCDIIKKQFPDPLSIERYKRYKYTYEVISFPIIRRIFERETSEENMDIEIIIEYVKDIHNKLMKSDIEAEFSALFSDLYKLKNN